MPSNRQGETSDHDTCPTTVLMKYEVAEEELPGLDKTPAFLKESPENINEESKSGSGSPKKEQGMSIEQIKKEHLI